jgi:uncharacterized membrane protein YhaH (DUF805 family)
VLKSREIHNTKHYNVDMDINTFLRVNGLSNTSSTDEIREALSAGRYSVEEIENFLTNPSNEFKRESTTLAPNILKVETNPQHSTEVIEIKITNKNSWGRIGRFHFFLGQILLIVVTALLLTIMFLTAMALGGPGTPKIFEYGIIGIILLLVALTVALAFSQIVKRLHDVGYPGWILLLNFIPYVYIVLTLFLLFKRGDQGINKYGAPSEHGFWRSLFSR